MTNYQYSVQKESTSRYKSSKGWVFFIYWKDFHIHVSLWGETDAKGRKKYFNIGENISNEQIYTLLDNVERDNKEEIDNLINDSDRELITDEEILSANITLDTSLTTPEANIHVVRDNEESKKPDKKKNEEPWKWIKKAKANKQEPCAFIPNCRVLESGQLDWK